MDKSNPSDILPRHRASASKAAASFAHQLDSDGSSDLEVVEDAMDKISASARKERTAVEVQYGKKTNFRARASSIKGSTTKVPYGASSSDAVLSTSLVMSTSSHRPGPYPTDKKARNKKGLVLYLATDPSSLITESDVSDLTDLPSSMLSSSPDIISPINNDVPRPPLCTPPKIIPFTARFGLKYEQLAELDKPAWSANDLDSYVWVLLEPKNKHVYDPDRDENDCKERLWWPAKVCVCKYTFKFKEGQCVSKLPIDPQHKKH